MRTDPRKACANKEERLLWALVHDGLAHVLMALTFYSAWSVRFHDWTSQRAWPRNRPAKVGFSLCTTDPKEAEFLRMAYKARGHGVWSKTTPLGDGVFLYQVAPL